MNLIKRLNYFFFLEDPEDDLHPSDGWCFYGTLGGSLLLTLVLWVVTL